MHFNIPVEAANYFLAMPDTVRDDELTKFECPGVFEVFQLGDGRMLEIYIRPTIAYKPDGTPVQIRSEPEVGDAWIYDSRQDFLSIKNNSLNLSPDKYPPCDLFKNAFPLRAKLFENGPKLIQKLPMILHIEAEQIDFSQDSLTIIEQAICRIGDHRVLDPRILQPLIAYLGMIITKVTGGRIEMVKSESMGWLPYIILPSGYRSSVL